MRFSNFRTNHCITPNLKFSEPLKKLIGIGNSLIPALINKLFIIRFVHWYTIKRITNIFESVLNI